MYIYSKNILIFAEKITQEQLHTRYEGMEKLLLAEDGYYHKW